MLAGETTYALTKDAVSFGAQRRCEAKGFAGGLPAFQVEELTTRSARRTIPFVGRMNELDILRGSSRACVSTARRCCSRSSASRASASRGSATSSWPGSTRTSPSSAAGADVRRQRDVRAGRRDGPRHRRHRRRQAAGQSDAPPARRGATAVRAERGGAGRRAARPDARARRPRREESVFVQDVQSGFLALVEGLGGARQVVLVFEDVHEHRSPMLDLIERSRPRPGHARSGPSPSRGGPSSRGAADWGSGSANAAPCTSSRCRAGRMRPSSCGGERRSVGDAEAAAIAVRTGGNPFFIVETTGMLLRAPAPAGAAAGSGAAADGAGGRRRAPGQPAAARCATSPAASPSSCGRSTRTSSGRLGGRPGRSSRGWRTRRSSSATKPAGAALAVPSRDAARGGVREPAQARAAAAAPGDRATA